MKNKLVGAKWGAIAGGSLVMLRKTLDAFTDNGKWLPKRRQTERNINEYFDILEYIKNRGLYEYASEEARRKEGFDVEEFFEKLEEKERRTKAEREKLEAEKRRLTLEDRRLRRAALEQDDDFVKNPRITAINKRLDALSNQKELLSLGPIGAAAVRYRQAYESTLYGADSSDVQTIIGALPKKEREYFTAFLKAKPSEREEILSLVPNNERRFLQAAWGMKQDTKPDLEKYFKSHYLPRAGWEGWSDQKELDDIKVRVIKNEALDLSEFGFWKNDLERAEAAKAPIVPVNKPSNVDPEKTLRDIFRGIGLRDIDITITETDRPGVIMAVDIEKDRRKDIVDYVNDNIGSLLGE